jgi:thiol:disulfide interchange protein DsbD
MKKSILSFFLILFAAISLKAQILEPVKWEITASGINENNEMTVTFRATVEKGWHVYGTDLPEGGPVSTTFFFEKLENAETTGQPAGNSNLIKKYEPMFEMELNWYENEALFTQKIKIKDPKNYRIKGYVEYMACNNENCLPPTREPFSIGYSPETVITGEENSELFVFNPLKNNKSTGFWQPVIDQLNSFGSEDTHQAGDSFWIIFLKGLLGGLIAIITPCVWPIIPMTVSFFLKRGKDPRKGKRAAFAYGLSIVFIYVVIGLIITAIFGASALNALSTNAIFNILIFALLVLFAISFFGGFDIALPATWSTKLDNRADKASGLFSILLMAATLVIVSFSCTGPIIGTLLVHVSGGSIMAPAIGMLGFAIALAGPFTIFAFFPSWLHNLPRSGGWLNSVKIVLGFFELAFALKFLSVADLAYGWHILDREVFLVLWIVIFSLLGLYFLGKIRFSGDDKVETINVPRIFMAIGVFAFVVYLFPGLFGAPLKSVSAFAPPVFTQDFNLHNQVHAKFDDYDDGMAYAAKNNKPVVVDFTGFGCVNCRKMEATVWNNKEVSNLLTEKYVLISLFVDDRKPLKEPLVVIENGKEKEIKTIGDKWSYLQRSKFGANAQPYYVLLDNEGNALNKPFAFSESANDFTDFLKTGLTNFNAK